MADDWLIELGHSRLKWARLDLSQAIAQAVEPRSMPTDEFLQTIPSLETPARAWISAVPLPAVVQPVLSSLQQIGIEIHRVTPEHMSLPVSPAYTELGVDRWLAMQPVWNWFKAAFVLVDCGTATTMDYVDPQGLHQGGWIFPGRNASRTGLLASAPGLKRDAQPSLEFDTVLTPARSTLNSIERGLLLQQAGAVAQVFRSLKAALDASLQLVVTGGDAPAIRSMLCRFEPDFTRMPCHDQASLMQSPQPNTSALWHIPELALRGLAMAAARFD